MIDAGSRPVVATYPQDGQQILWISDGTLELGPDSIVTMPTTVEIASDKVAIWFQWQPVLSSEFLYFQCDRANYCTVTVGSDSASL